MQRFATDVNVACFFAQRAPPPARAGAVVLVFAQFFAHGLAVGFAVAAFEIGMIPSKAWLRLKVVPRSDR